MSFFHCLNCQLVYVFLLILIGEKAFKCRICGKAFAQPSVLRKHKRTHSGSLLLVLVCFCCVCTYHPHLSLLRSLWLIKQPNTQIIGLNHETSQELVKFLRWSLLIVFPSRLVCFPPVDGERSRNSLNLMINVMINLISVRKYLNDVMGYCFLSMSRRCSHA